MMFENEADYEAYNVHPQHVDFVENRWKKEVEQFLEIDYNEVKKMNTHKYTQRRREHIE